ncbi:HigA family addiction module antitoxin [Leptospira kmetyi]|uniref:HigA family addiction module antitoxin n=1 Tax=Leptospira kmetyi TaxID=408139 RepID=UPI000A034321|nr:HigA family addiction module antitoxin [Leptospira kmetyi]
MRRGNRRLSLGERNRKKIPNVHPAEILNEEFLLPMKITAYRLAKETKLNPTRISEIIRGKRGITADTALRFSKFFGNSVEFWMGIQDEFEIREERRKIGPELEGIRHYKELIKA